MYLLQAANGQKYRNRFFSPAHGLEAVRRMVSDENLEGNVGRTAARIAGMRRNRLVGSLVRTSQKEGEGVGNTKCRKGTNVVVHGSDHSQAARAWNCLVGVPAASVI